MGTHMRTGRLFKVNLLKLKKMENTIYNEIIERKGARSFEQLSQKCFFCSRYLNSGRFHFVCDAMVCEQCLLYHTDNETEEEDVVVKYTIHQISELTSISCQYGFNETYETYTQKMICRSCNMILFCNKVKVCKKCWPKIIAK